MAWLLVTLVAVAAASPPPIVARQALATVHIVRPVTIALGRSSSGGDVPPVRAHAAQWRGDGGALQPANLIEFP